MNQLFIVIYESTDVLGKHSFEAHHVVFTDWIEADKWARMNSAWRKKRSWVTAFERPNLIELVKS